MSEKKSQLNNLSQFTALNALKRSARKAIEIARQTGTAAWVMEGDKIVDAAKQPRGKSRKKTAARKQKHRS